MSNDPIIIDIDDTEQQPIQYHTSEQSKNIVILLEDDESSDDDDIVMEEPPSQPVLNVIEPLVTHNNDNNNEEVSDDDRVIDDTEDDNNNSEQIVVVDPPVKQSKVCITISKKADDDSSLAIQPLDTFDTDKNLANGGGSSGGFSLFTSARGKTITLSSEKLNQAQSLLTKSKANKSSNFTHSRQTTTDESINNHSDQPTISDVQQPLSQCSTSSSQTSTQNGGGGGLSDLLDMMSQLSQQQTSQEGNIPCAKSNVDSEESLSAHSEVNRDNNAMEVIRMETEVESNAASSSSKNRKRTRVEHENEDSSPVHMSKRNKLGEFETDLKYHNDQYDTPVQQPQEIIISSIGADSDDISSLFRSATGRSLSFSSETLQKAQSLMPLETEKPSNGGGFSLFASARGKSIALSSEKLNKAESLLSKKKKSDEISKVPNTNSDVDQAHPLPELETEKPRSESSFSLFASARGKSIALSSEKLNKAESLLNKKKNNSDDVSDVTNEKSELEKNQSLVPLETEKPSNGGGFSLFASARGKSIALSSEKLNKAESLLNKKKKSEEISKVTSRDSESPASSSREQTVEEQQETDDASSIQTRELESRPPVTDIGSLFSSGRGKKLDFSAEKLKAAERRLVPKKDESDSGTGKKETVGKQQSLMVTGSSPNKELPNASGTQQQVMSSSQTRKVGTPITKSILGARPRRVTPSANTPVRSDVSSPSQQTPGKKSPEFVTPNKSALTHKRNKFVTPFKVATPVTPPLTPGAPRVNLGRTSAPAPVKPSSLKITAPSWLNVKKPGRANKIGLSNLASAQDAKSLYSLALTQVNQKILYMTSQSAKDFRFDASFSVSSNFLSLIEEAQNNKNLKCDYDSGSSSFPTNSSASIGFKTFRLLLLHLGAAEHIVTNLWVQNHFRWIVWKLASYERRFSTKCASKFLTPEQTLSQLIFRYDREYCTGKRSSIAKITEKDATPQPYMVLCVASLSPPMSMRTNSDLDDYMIELTDGWYSILAKLDDPLLRLRNFGKLVEGQKLRLCGTQIFGADNGVPPLEITSSMYLLLHINGVRKARWDAPLGFQCQENFRVNIKSIHKEGGGIPCLDIVVQKRFPVLHMEKRKAQNLPNIIRSDRAEIEASRLVEERESISREKIAQDVIKEMEQEKREERQRWKPVSRATLKTLTDGYSLYKALQKHGDPNAEFSLLTLDQQRAYQSYADNQHAREMLELEDRIKSEMDEVQREVTRTLDIKIRDCCPHRQKDGRIDSYQNECIFRIYDAGDEAMEVFEEGNQVRIYNLQVNNYSGGQDIHLSLSASRSTCWRVIKRARDMSDEEKVKLNVYQRIPLSITELSNTDMNHQFDFVGVVLSTGPPKSYTSKKNNFTFTVKEIYVTDGSTDDRILLIRLRESETRIIGWDFIQSGCCYSFFNLTLQDFDRSNGMYVCLANEASDAVIRPSQPAFKHKLSSVTEWTVNNKDVFTKLGERVSQQQMAKSKHANASFGPTRSYGNLTLDNSNPSIISVSYNDGTVEGFSLPGGSIVPLLFQFNHENQEFIQAQVQSFSLKMLFDDGNEYQEIKVEEEAFRTLVTKIWTCHPDHPLPEWFTRLTDENQIALNPCAVVQTVLLAQSKKSYSSVAERVYEYVKLVMFGSVVLASEDQVADASPIQELISKNNKLMFMTQEWLSLLGDIAAMMRKPMYKIYTNEEHVVDPKTIDCVHADSSVRMMLADDEE